MKFAGSMVAVAGAFMTTVAASAQSFNVDVGTATVGSPGFGAPSAAHGGAANQVGFWNNFTGTGAGPLALADLGGGATGVTLTRSTGAGGNFAFDNLNASGDYGLLLDDGQDNGNVTYTFNNLAAGVYDVYGYAVAPDSATFVTAVLVGGGPAQNVGGAIPVNAYQLGVTHALFAGHNHAGGNLAINFSVVTSFGTINGMQLVLVPAPGALALLGVAGLIGPRRRRN